MIEDKQKRLHFSMLPDFKDGYDKALEELKEMLKAEEKKDSQDYGRCKVKVVTT